MKQIIEGALLAAGRPLTLDELADLFDLTDRPALEELGEAVQALCFLAGANSIFYCDKLLTTMNAGTNRDVAMFEKLGLKAV